MPAVCENRGHFQFYVINIYMSSNYETKKCSILLKRTNVKIAYITDQREILELQKEKAPDGDRTP